MSATSGIKQHVSIDERNKWDKVVADFSAHLGSGGVANHKLGDGSVPGFSTNDFTNVQKTKLAGIQDGALNNPHPATHPYTMIDGLKQISWTASYNHLVDVPLTFIAGGGNSDTVGGIRITIAASSPASPVINKEIWINTTNRTINIYDGAWRACRAWFA